MWDSNTIQGDTTLLCPGLWQYVNRAFCNKICGAVMVVFCWCLFDSRVGRISPPDQKTKAYPSILAVQTNSKNVFFNIVNFCTHVYYVFVLGNLAR